MLLNETWITKNIREEIKKFLEVSENNDKTYQNLWDTMKAVLRQQFTAWRAFQKRMKSKQLNDLTLQLKTLELEEESNSKSRRQEIIKIRSEINEIDQKK